MVTRRNQAASTKAKEGFRDLLVYFGLAHPGGDDAPLPGGPRTSRYGINVSPRLDQDIDALKARIAELEARAR